MHDRHVEWVQKGGGCNPDKSYPKLSDVRRFRSRAYEYSGPHTAPYRYVWMHKSLVGFALSLPASHEYSIQGNASAVQQAIEGSC